MDDWRYDPAGDLGLSQNERMRSLRREAGLLSMLSSQAWWGVVRAYLKLGHRLRVVGADRIPREPPFVLVSNHSSHLDTLALASALPPGLVRRVFPIASGDTFFETPALATFAALLMNALPLWRRNCGPHALDQLRERLVEQPSAYILFPEGTRSRAGEMGRFKPGIGRLIAGADVPIIPCYIDGAHRALSPKAKLPRPTKIRVFIGERLTFSGVANDRAGWNHIAQRTEAAVVQLRDGVR